MSETAVVGIAGVIGTLLAAVVGAWIAGHFTNKLRDRQRADQERDLLRTSMVDLITASRNWIDSVSPMSIVATSQIGKGELHHWATKVFPGMDEAKQIATARERVQRELSNARLVATDPELADWLARLEKHQRNWWHDIVSVALDPDVDEDFLRWIAYRDRFTELFGGTQERARELIVGRKVSNMSR